MIENFTYFLGGVDITDLDIITTNWENIEEINIASDDLSRFRDVSLTCTDLLLLDPVEPTSIFFGRVIWELQLEIYDAYDQLLYIGKIKNITINKSNNSIELETISIINITLDTILEYTNNESTLAAAFADILIINNLLDYLGVEYRTAQELQEEHDLLFSIYYQKSDNTTLYDTLTLWSQITACDFFISNNKFEFRAWNLESLHDPVIEIIEDDIIEDIIITQNIDEIFNQYSFETPYGTLTDIEIGKASRANWGEHSAFNISLNSDSQIATSSLSGLQWSGETTIQRNQEPHLYLEFGLYKNFKFNLNLGSEFKFSAANEDSKVFSLINKVFCVIGLNRQVDSVGVKAVLMGDL